MAKESKQDRIARQMQDHLSEHLIELKSHKANPNTKEIDIERWAQSFLKTCLGYSATNGYTIRAQEQKGKLRPDLVIYKGDQPIFVVEVKKLGYDLDKSDFRSGKVQLQEYLYSLGKVSYGFLCNGYEWRLFDFTSGINAFEIFSVDLRDDENNIDTNKKLVEDKCYELVNLYESAYTGKEWIDLFKEATAFAPDSLSRAILTPNVIKAIIKEVRGEHEYKACLDSMFKKVYELLSLGLDDSIKDFNDEKKAEFQKYIKAQIKSSKKIKRVKSESDQAAQKTDEIQNSTTMNDNTSPVCIVENNEIKKDAA